MNEYQLRTAHLVASVLLSFPDDDLRDSLPLLAQAVDTLPAGPVADHLGAFLSRPHDGLADHYVATFDLQPRCSPYLAAHARDGARLRFTRAFRAAGYEPADGERPDHLAVVCELSARGATEAAVGLLREHRAGLRLLLRALADEGSPYADVVAAVDRSLSLEFGEQ